MPLATSANITGDEGEFLAGLVLSKVATVNPYRKDQGLDFHCELREETNFEFYVQAKASASPKYGDDTIISLPIDRETIEDYWLTKHFPVFVLMSDTQTRRTYYMPVNRDTYQPGGPDDGTYTFAIPIGNEIAPENVGRLVNEIVRLQPHLAQVCALQWFERFQERHPLLYQDLRQINELCEDLRGPDRHLQTRARSTILRLFEAGQLDSLHLIDDLVTTFKSSTDRITQHTVLDTLIGLDVARMAPEIIRKIEHNLELDEYRKMDPGYRHYYTSFLFDALIRFRARGILPDLRPCFDHPEPHVVQGAVRVCGELRLKGGSRDLEALLSHPDSSVRKTTAQALAKYGYKRTVIKCVRILRKPESAEAIDGAIRTLSEFQDYDNVDLVIGFAKHDDPRVRQAVAHYLGTVQSNQSLDILTDLLVDSNRDVRVVANRSLADPQKEAFILPRLEAAFDNGDELLVSSLVSALHACASEASVPLLLRIYREDDGVCQTTTRNSHQRQLEMPMAKAYTVEHCVPI